MRNKIKKILAEILEVNPDSIKDTDDFITDLGMDSMSALEFVSGIEKEFKIVISEDLLFELTTIAKAEEAINQMKK